MPWAATLEEGAFTLSPFTALFAWDLADARAVLSARAVGEARDVTFHIHETLAPEATIAGALAADAEAGGVASGGGNASSWARCNAVILDVCPVFLTDTATATCSATTACTTSSPPRLPPPQKRAVHFLEPFAVKAAGAIAGGLAALSYLQFRARLTAASVIRHSGLEPE